MAISDDIFLGHEVCRFRWSRAPRFESATDDSSNSRLHGLVAWPLSNICCRELCETAGKNVTVTKHGFQPWLWSRLKRYVVVDGPAGEAWSGRQCRLKGTAAVGPLGGKSCWAHHGESDLALMAMKVARAG
jgi:hypothetical protein